MRKNVRLFAAVSFAVAAMSSFPQVASAGQDTRSAQVECTQTTDRSTIATVVCKTDRRYRVVADYCRLNCTREFGPWKYNPFRSEVNFPSGGTIVNSWFEIE
ncbi:hypothetical protein [Amycolatopsis magusensis]|uniref:hypothetical protein n=1 Tax=Amycolatopsis magusensis TaxID=882444 RepID=UPI0037A0640E